MSTKAFGIYSSKGDDANNANEELTIEIGNSHFACLALGSDNMITGFELFNLSKEETVNFENFFFGITSKSQLLDRTFTNTRVYINNEYAQLIPKAKFDEEILSDFMNVAFGEDENSIRRFDSIDGEPNLINAFRLSPEWLSVIEQQLKLGRVQHTYTPVIRSLITSATNATLVKVNFYPTYFIAAVIKEGMFHFIQSFIYQSSDDVLYYLLSISQRFNLNTTDLAVYISGLIDLQSPLYSQLEKFFGNVVVEEADKNKLLIDVSEHPSHYFTPFSTLYYENNFGETRRKKD